MPEQTWRCYTCGRVFGSFKAFASRRHECGRAVRDGLGGRAADRGQRRFRRAVRRAHEREKAASKDVPLLGKLLFRVPLPPSTNHAHGHGRGRVYLAPETVAYREEVERILLPWRLPRDCPIGLEAIAWLTCPDFDLGNVEKQLMDAIAPALCFNDRQIAAQHLYKRVDPSDPHVDVKLYWPVEGVPDALSF